MRNIKWAGCLAPTALVIALPIATGSLEARAANSSLPAGATVATANNTQTSLLPDLPKLQGCSADYTGHTGKGDLGGDLKDGNAACWTLPSGDLQWILGGGFDLVTPPAGFAKQHAVYVHGHQQDINGKPSNQLDTAKMSALAGALKNVGPYEIGAFAETGWMNGPVLKGLQADFALEHRIIEHTGFRSSPPSSKFRPLADFTSTNRVSFIKIKLPDPFPTFNLSGIGCTKTGNAEVSVSGGGSLGVGFRGHDAPQAPLCGTPSPVGDEGIAVAIIQQASPYNVDTNKMGPNHFPNFVEAVAQMMTGNNELTIGAKFFSPLLKPPVRRPLGPTNRYVGFTFGYTF
jgi:hypothetical protein